MKNKFSDIFKIPFIPRINEIGLEIEIEGKKLLGIDSVYWISERDGSLRGEETIEYVLRKPIRLNQVRPVLRILKKELKQNKTIIEVSDRCSAHVHINIQHMLEKEVFIFILLYLIVEEILIAYCGEGRIGNLFCLRAKDAEVLIDRLIKIKRRGTFKGLQRRDFRYSAINLEALLKFGSLEFRALKTPKELLDIAKWVDIIYQIKKASFFFKKEEELITAFSFLGEEIFLEKVFGDSYQILKKKNIKNIEQKIYRGIRLIQDVVYAPKLQDKLPLLPDVPDIFDDMYDEE